MSGRRGSGRGRGRGRGAGRQSHSAAQSNLAQILSTIEAQGSTLNASSAVSVYMKLCRALPHPSQQGSSSSETFPIAPSVESLTKTISTGLETLSAATIASYIWCLSKTQAWISSANAKSLAQTAVDHLTDRFQEIIIQERSSTSAHVDVYCGKGPHVMLNSKSVSNLLYGSASLSLILSSNLIHGLAVAVNNGTSGSGDWVTQGAANSLWSLGKLGLKASDSPAVLALLNALSHRLHALLLLPPSQHAGVLLPQHLSNSLHGMASCAYITPIKGLLDTLCSSTMTMLGQFSAQEVTNVIWSLAQFHRLGATLPDKFWSLLGHVADFVSSALQEQRWRAGLRPQTISNLAWAYASLKQKPLRLFSDLAVEATHLLSQFKPQELANLQYAFALADFSPSIAALDEMVAATARIARQMKPEELSSTLWAWATLRYLPTAEIMQHMLECAGALLDNGSFKSQELGNIIWALGRLAWMPGTEFAEKMKGTVHNSSIWESCAAQDATNALWGLSCLDVLNEATMIELCLRLKQMHSGSGKIAPENYVQIFVAHQHLQQKQDIRGKGYQEATEVLLARGAEENARQMKIAHVSATQRDVAAALTRCGYRFEMENVVDKDLPAVDLVILGDREESNRITALEVDGASHFTINGPSYAPLGKSVLRWRALAAKNCNVVSIPFYAWNVLPSDEAKCDYIERLLRCGSVWECLTESTTCEGQKFPLPRNFAHLSPSAAVAECRQELSQRSKDLAITSPASVVPLKGVDLSISASVTPTVGPVAGAVSKNTGLNISAAPFVLKKKAAPQPLEELFSTRLKIIHAAKDELDEVLRNYVEHLAEECIGAGAACSACCAAVTALWSTGIADLQHKSLCIYNAALKNTTVPAAQVLWPSYRFLQVHLSGDSNADLALTTEDIVEALGTTLVAHKAPFKLQYQAGKPQKLECASKLLQTWLFLPDFVEWEQSIGCSSGGSGSDDGGEKVLEALELKEKRVQKAKNTVQSAENLSIEQWMAVFREIVGEAEASVRAIGTAEHVVAAETAAGRHLVADTLSRALAAVYVGRRQQGLLPWMPAVLLEVQQERGDGKKEEEAVARNIVQLMESRGLVVKGNATVAAVIS